MIRSVVVAGFTLVAVRAALLIGGFERAVRWTRRVGGWAARRLPTPPAAERVMRTVAVAAAFFPGRAVCLEQSLAGYLLLHRAGHRPALRVGVQPLPFEAHAWLEVDGRPVLENEDELARFVAFPGAFA